jgi:RNA polymerase sigma factor (sigma-70 family)
MNGTDLLAEFRKSRSMNRSANWFAATRTLSIPRKAAAANEDAAEEATQSVFIRLAATAPELRDDAALVALAASDHRSRFHRSLARRVPPPRREEQAAAMQTQADDTAWNEIAPVIDEALNELNDAERQVILLRFFEHKSMRELGAVFGISEDAAKMRVSRALERLRERVGTKGAACGVLALGTMLTNRAVEAAPATLVATLMCVIWPMPAVVSGGGGFGAALLQVHRAKLALGVAAVAISAIIFFVSRSARQAMLLSPRLRSSKAISAPPHRRRLRQGLRKRRRSKARLNPTRCNCFRQWRGRVSAFNPARWR